MKTTKDILNHKKPLVAIDKSLNELSDKVKFGQKLEKANEFLGKINLPKKKEVKLLSK